MTSIAVGPLERLAGDEYALADERVHLYAGNLMVQVVKTYEGVIVDVYSVRNPEATVLLGTVAVGFDDDDAEEDE